MKFFSFSAKLGVDIRNAIEYSMGMSNECSFDNRNNVLDRSKN